MKDSTFLNRVKTVGIFGASGAIGRAYLSFFSNVDSVETIHAFSRTAINVSSRKIITHHIDYSKESSIINSKKKLPKDTFFDLLLVTSGSLHHKDFMPEKSIKQFSADSAYFFYLVNTIGPGLIMKHFYTLLNRDTPSIMAFLCARIGSISDNRLGGWYSYRASKAALAMMIKTMSIELKRYHPKAICIGLHPGTVDTPLSQPFQKNISPKTIQSPSDSVQNMIHTLEHLTINDSGFQYAYDGTKIPE